MSNVKRVKENDYSDIFLLVNTSVVSFDNQFYMFINIYLGIQFNYIQYNQKLMVSK